MSSPSLDSSLADLSENVDKSQISALTRSLEQADHWNRRTRRAAYRAAMKANAFAAKVASAANRKLKKPLKRADRSRKEANQTKKDANIIRTLSRPMRLNTSPGSTMLF